MKYRLELSEFRLFPIASKSRAILVTVAMLTLASCASQGAREAELAAVEAERIAMEQEAAQVAVEQERARAAQLQREQAEAERARVQAQRDRQLAEARARAEAERQVAEAEEQRERERLAAIAAVEAQRQEKLDRIAALEQQIASIQTDVVDEESRTASLAQAVEVAEELLVVLEDEQNKYENTDEAGNTLEPLAKDLIAELESRKDELLRQSNSQ
jgi:hypothetical protein